MHNKCLQKTLKRKTKTRQLVTTTIRIICDDVTFSYFHCTLFHVDFFNYL